MTFNATGGTVTPTSATTNAQNKLTSLPTPEYEGYVFLGWFNHNSAGTQITVDVTDDSYYKLTAENFSILTAMVNDPTLMTNKFKAGDGVEQNDLLEALKDMTSERDVNSFRGSTASGFLEGVLSDVALGAAAANTGVTSYETVQKAIGNVRLSVSGVDEDEEAVNLVKFQNAFNLSSKMISVFQEIYKRLILETGV